MPQNSDPAAEGVSDPVLASLDAARERWLATRNPSAVRLPLLDALRALEK